MDKLPYCTGTVPLTGMPPIVPVTVRDVIPVGTLMAKEAAEEPMAMVVVDGTTFEELLDSDTVTFSNAAFARLKVTVACPPAGAGLGENVIAASVSRTQGMLFDWAGTFDGGVDQGTLEKSKNSVMSG